MEIPFTIDYPITLPAKPYAIEADTLRAAISECGIDWTDAPAMTPAKVMATCPIDGLRVLAKCVAIDWRKSFADLLGSERQINAYDADDMCIMIRRIVDAVTDLYSETDEGVAVVEGVLYSPGFGEDENIDIDLVTVDGVEMSESEFNRCIDRREVFALARAKCL